MVVTRRHTAGAIRSSGSPARQILIVPSIIHGTKLKARPVGCPVVRERRYIACRMECSGRNSRMRDDQERKRLRTQPSLCAHTNRQRSGASVSGEVSTNRFGRFVLARHFHCCKTTCDGTQNLKPNALRVRIDTPLSGDIQRIFGLSHFTDYVISQTYVLMMRLSRFCDPLHINVGPRS